MGIITKGIQLGRFVQLRADGSLSLNTELFSWNTRIGKSCAVLAQSLRKVYVCRNSAQFQFSKWTGRPGAYEVSLGPFNTCKFKSFI